MFRIDRDAMLELVLVGLLIFSFYLAGSFWYLDVAKSGIADRHKAVYMGLATALSFSMGLLLMYAVHKLRVVAVEVYSEKLVDEVKRLEQRLSKCMSECGCAADAYVALLSVALMAEGVRRNAKI
jgi:hypothetical protein